MSEIEDRSERLTPREWRVVALVVEGVPGTEACSLLGIAPGTLESHKQAIRRKLGIPRGDRLEKHLQDLADRIPDPKPRAQESSPFALNEQPNNLDSERRVRLLFRMTVEELQEVAGNAELRASLLEQTIKRMSSEDMDGAQREIEDLRSASARIRDAAAEMLAAVRTRTREA